MKVKNNHRIKFSSFLRASTGFEPVTSAKYRCLQQVLRRFPAAAQETSPHARERQKTSPLQSSLLRSRSGRSHVTLPVPTRLLQTDIHSFLGVLRFCLLGPMSLSFSCHCIHCTNHRREHSQQNESHTLIGLFPRKECTSV